MGRRRAHKPAGAVTVTTYGELDAFFSAFHRGALGLLIVVGEPGTQKSHLASAAHDRTTVVAGHNSPLGVYRAASHARGRNLVLDDVDGLVDSPAGRTLLKELCSTQAVKKVTWNTAAQALASEGIPREFSARAKIAIITNSWPALDEYIDAVADRGHLIFFEPAPIEIHLRAAEWFWDQEIFDFVAARLHLFDRLSMRLYAKAAEEKAAGLDWHRLVLSACLTGHALLVAWLKADPSFATEEERVKAFVGRCGACRATYFNHAKRLTPPPSKPPSVVLRSTAPPEEPVDALDLMSWIQDRHPRIGRG